MKTILLPYPSCLGTVIGFGPVISCHHHSHVVREVSRVVLLYPLICHPDLSAPSLGPFVFPLTHRRAIVSVRPLCMHALTVTGPFEHVCTSASRTHSAHRPASSITYHHSVYSCSAISSSIPGPSFAAASQFVSLRQNMQRLWNLLLAALVLRARVGCDLHET